MLTQLSQLSHILCAFETVVSEQPNEMVWCRWPELVQLEVQPVTATVCGVCLYEGSYCSEFRCSNGKCIDRELHCDTVDHCFDSSDERRCG